MRNLLSLLERFSKSLNKDTYTKEVILGVIENKTHVSLKPESINLKEGVLSLEATPGVKNEISLKEDLIKEELKNLHQIQIARILYK